MSRRKPTLLEQLPGYRKAVAGLLLAVGTWGATAAPDGIDGPEWFGLLVALATGLGVAQVSNAETDDEGASELVTIAGGILLAAFVLWLFGAWR